MNRRNFLTALSCLPFMGWLKPAAPMISNAATLPVSVGTDYITLGTVAPECVSAICYYDPSPYEFSDEIEAGDVVYWNGAGVHVARRLKPKP